MTIIEKDMILCSTFVNGSKSVSKKNLYQKIVPKIIAKSTERKMSVSKCNLHLRRKSENGEQWDAFCCFRSFVKLYFLWRSFTINIQFPSESKFRH